MDKLKIIQYIVDNVDTDNHRDAMSMIDLVLKHDNALHFANEVLNLLEKDGVIHRRDALQMFNVINMFATELENTRSIPESNIVKISVDDIPAVSLGKHNIYEHAVPKSYVLGTLYDLVGILRNHLEDSDDASKRFATKSITINQTGNMIESNKCYEYRLEFVRNLNESTRV